MFNSTLFKKIVSLLFFCFVVTNLKAVILVSSDHKYYPLINKYIINNLNSNYDIEAILENDTAEECVEKILKGIKNLKIQLAKEEGYEYYLKKYEKYCLIVAESYKRYPQDEFLLTLYADIVLNNNQYSFANTLKYNFYNNKFTEIISELSPYIQESNKIPRIPYLFWRLFRLLDANLPNTDFITKDTSDTQDNKYQIHNEYTDTFRALDITSRSDDKRKLIMLINYWGSKIDLKYIDNSKERFLIEEAKRQMTSPSSYQEALITWKHFLLFSNNDHYYRLKMIKDNNKQMNQSNISNPNKENLIPEKITETTFENNNQLEKLLEELKIPRKWDIHEIEYFMIRLQQFEKVLKNTLELPGLDELYKNKNINANDIQALNLWYKMVIHKSYKEILASIEKVPNWSNDSKFVFLKLICARELGQNKEMLLKLSELLISLEPKEKRFRHLKLSIELQEEF